MVDSVSFSNDEEFPIIYDMNHFVTIYKDDIYKKYDKNDLMAKARVISAGQLNKLQPVFRTQKNQKEINNLVNNAVQNILLNKDETEKILKELDKNIKLLEK